MHGTLQKRDSSLPPPRLAFTNCSVRQLSEPCNPYNSNHILICIIASVRSRSYQRRNKFVSKTDLLSSVLIQTFGDMSMFIPVPQTCLL